MPWYHERQAPGTTGIIQHLAGLGHVGDAVFELHEDIGAVIDA